MVVFIFQKESLKLLGVQQLTTTSAEGWGLTHDTNSIIVSDGSSFIDFFDIPLSSVYSESHRDRKIFDPWTFQRRIQVIDGDGKPVKHLNELEYVDGYLFANIWYQDIIVKIDINSGRVVQSFNLDDLFPVSKRPRTADCMNGIAFNSENNEFLITGKQWPTSFLIKLNQRLLSEDVAPASELR